MKEYLISLKEKEIFKLQDAIKTRMNIYQLIQGDKNCYWEDRIIFDSIMKKLFQSLEENK